MDYCLSYGVGDNHHNGFKIELVNTYTHVFTDEEQGEIRKGILTLVNFYKKKKEREQLKIDEDFLKKTFPKCYK